jgi:pyruvate formate lyase activating enzyme
MSEEENKIQCNNCARRCNILSGEIGYCGVRFNEGGNLKILNYGKFVILKKEEENLLVGNLGSNMRFSFDMNWDFSLFPHLQAKKLGRKKTNKLLVELGNYYEPRQLSIYAKSLDCKKIVFQYNEPLIYMEYIEDVIKENLVEVGIVTTGYFTEKFFKELLGKISSVDILFFSTFDKFYFKHSRAQLSIIKENITKLYEENFNFRIIYPIIKGENDRREDIESLSKFLLSLSPNLSLVFTKYYPSYRMVDKRITSDNLLKQSKDIALKVGLQNVMLEG